MQGTMLSFNADKGYGFIQTEAGERLYVARSGFLPNHDPKPRCRGKR
jgi:cold shock CspA family protein